MSHNNTLTSPRAKQTFNADTIEEKDLITFPYDDSDWLDETCFVVDLDETLVHTKFEIESLLKLKILSDPKYRHLRSRIIILDFYDEKGKLVDDHMWSIKRPGVDELLTEVHKISTYVIVWSAGLRHYVDRIVKGVWLDGNHPAPHAVLARDACYKLSDGDLVKPLNLLYQHLPWLIGRVKRQNMVLLDNKENNFMFNEERGLLIDDYEPHPVIEDIEKHDSFLLGAIDQIKRRFEQPPDEIYT